MTTRGSDYVNDIEMRRYELHGSDLIETDDFRNVLAEMGALHDKKRQDYGTDADPYANVRAVEEFGIEPWLGAILKCSDKMSRIKAYIQNGKLANEGIEDTLIDMAVYSVIALVLWREHARQKD